MIFQGFKQKRDHARRKDKHSCFKEQCLAEANIMSRIMSSTTQN